MFFGAATESAKAAHRNQKLKKMIKNESQVMQNSVIEFYTGIEKFQYTYEIIDVFLELTPTHNHNFYLDKLSTEFFKAKQDMSTEPMNQAQGIALALAVKELALNFDANEKELKTFINETKNNFEIQIDLLNRQASETLKSITIQSNNVLNENSETFKKIIDDNLSKLDLINMQQKQLLEQTHDLLLQKSKVELDRKNFLIEKKFEISLAKSNSKLNYVFSILVIFIFLNIMLGTFLFYKILWESQRKEYNISSKNKLYTKRCHHYSSFTKKQLFYLQIYLSCLFTDSARSIYDYWLNPNTVKNIPKENQEKFLGTVEKIKAALAPYEKAKKVKVFSDKSLAFGYIGFKPAFGHTPGHYSFKLKTQGQDVVFIGDIVHSHSLQFEQPKTTVDFNIDSKTAVETRLKYFAEYAKEGQLIAAPHLPFPGLGHIYSKDEQSYQWIPVHFKD